MTGWGNFTARGNYAVNMGQTRFHVSSGPVGPFGIKNLASSNWVHTVPFETVANHGWQLQNAFDVGVAMRAR